MRHASSIARRIARRIGLRRRAVPVRPAQVVCGRGNRAHGFTLIEVVVAVAVVSIGLAAALGGINRVTANTTLLQERTLASWIAQNRITEFRLQPTLPEIGESNGDVEFAAQEWVWEAEVIATQVEALRRIEVRVRYEDGGRILATAVGFVGTPPPAGGQPTPWTPQAGGQAGELPGGFPLRTRDVAPPDAIAPDQ